MSVLPSDIVAYGSGAMPEADSATAGGAPDLTRRIAFYDVTPAGTCDVISSSTSDTATKITVYGRDPTGAIQNYTATLNGQTWVPARRASSGCFMPHSRGRPRTGRSRTRAAPPPSATWRSPRTAASCRPRRSRPTATVHTCQTGSANASGVTPALIEAAIGRRRFGRGRATRLDQGRAPARTRSARSSPFRATAPISSRSAATGARSRTTRRPTKSCRA